MEPEKPEETPQVPAKPVNVSSTWKKTAITRVVARGGRGGGQGGEPHPDDPPEINLAPPPPPRNKEDSEEDGKPASGKKPQNPPGAAPKTSTPKKSQSGGTPTSGKELLEALQEMEKRRQRAEKHIREDTTKVKDKIQDPVDREKKIAGIDATARKQHERRSSGRSGVGMHLHPVRYRRRTINWLALLKKYVSKFILDSIRYTYTHPDRRHLGRDIYKRGEIEENLPTVDVIATVDTSGSISDEDFEQCITELRGMFTAFKGKATLRIIQWHTEIVDDVLVTQRDWKSFFAGKKKDRKESGGTTYQIVKPYILKKKYKPKLVITITDGDIPITKNVLITEGGCKNILLLYTQWSLGSRDEFKRIFDEVIPMNVVEKVESED